MATCIPDHQLSQNGGSVPELIESPWRVVQTDGGREAQVQGFLLHAGVTAYCPVFSIKTRTARQRNAIVQKSLFPGYVFARIEPRYWPEIERGIPYTRDLLRFGERAAIVSDAEILNVRRMMAGDKPPVGWDGLVVGAKVKVKLGAYSGLEGIFARPDGNELRVWVNIDLLGCSRGVLVDREMVEAA